MEKVSRRQLFAGAAATTAMPLLLSDDAPPVDTDEERARAIFDQIFGGEDLPPIDRSPLWWWS